MTEGRVVWSFGKFLSFFMVPMKSSVSYSLRLCLDDDSVFVTLRPCSEKRDEVIGDDPFPSFQDLRNTGSNEDPTRAGSEQTWHRLRRVKTGGTDDVT